jgi:hypothetical protein
MFVDVKFLFHKTFIVLRMLYEYDKQKKNLFYVKNNVVQ